MPHALKLAALSAALAAVTLVPKYLLAATPVQADEQRLARDMAAMLGRQGYRTRLVPHHLHALVEGRRGGCRLLAANAEASGYLRSSFGRLAAAVGPVRYRYAGAEAADFPRFGPVLAHYAQRWLYPFGIVLPRTPIVAVAASPGCAPEGADWGRLRLWPVRASR